MHAVHSGHAVSRYPIAGDSDTAVDNHERCRLPNVKLNVRLYLIDIAGGCDVCWMRRGIMVGFGNLCTGLLRIGPIDGGLIRSDCCCHDTTSLHAYPEKWTARTSLPVAAKALNQKKPAHVL